MTKGSKRLVQVGGLYICVPPAILELLESKEAIPTLEKFSKPTKELLDQILRFSTSFKSVSARLALE